VIHARALGQRMMALEDLGDETFEARLQQTAAADWAEPYGRAIDRLADLHGRCAPPQSPESSIVYRRRLDASLLRWELDHFREWGIEALHGSLEAGARAELDHVFDALVRAIVALPDGFVHRDYQSRNLMWVGSRLVVIDFQDAFVGPAPYDLVALLCDSYAAIDAKLQAQMIARYAERRGYGPQIHAALRRGFDLIAVQRKLKDAGRFVFIDRVRRNSGFLQYYPGSLIYVDRALTALDVLPEALALSALLRTLLPGFPNCPVPQPLADSA
jgi:N-acetylmuramate 1-kinase